jgi:homoserine kinase
MRTSATAFAPASVSNVACGFDIMGFALEEIGDTVTVHRSDTPGVRITKVTGIGTDLPRDPATNTACPPIITLALHAGYQGGFEVEIHKGFLCGSGLGSSAASAVAAAAACNELLGTGLSKRDLLGYALEGEQVASGALHADNVAPCMLGGFILIRGYDPLDIVRLDPPRDLWCAIVHPHTTIETRLSRKLLPASVPLRDVVTQTGNAAGLVAGLLQRDFGLISRSLKDVIAEPARAGTIEGFAEMKNAALRDGALGCSISGSGPALFALTSSEMVAKKAVSSMGDVLQQLNRPHTTFVSRVNTDGAIILRR